VNWNFQEILTKDPSSAWGCDTYWYIPPCGVALRRTCRCTEFHLLKTQIWATRLKCVKTTGNLNSRHCWACSTRNKKFCSSIATLGHTKFGRHRTHQKSWIDIVAASIVQFSPRNTILPSVCHWDKTCEDKTSPIFRHRRTSCPSGCRSRRVILKPREYVLLFKGKRRLSIRIENKLKNNNAFRNIPVNFYDIFRCPKCLLFKRTDCIYANLRSVC
jgi:hypothetical protein